MIGSQETGLVGASNESVLGNKYFGPPTRDNYPQSQWALTVTGATVSSTTSFPDVDPPQRKREPMQPVFVKPYPDLEYAPALLSILGQIPMILRYFLKFGTIAEDYGADAGWWKGSVIRRPLTVDLEAPDLEAERNKHFADEALREMHRVVAFFISSKRAYYADAVFKLFDDLRIQVASSNENRDYLGDTLVSFFCQGWTAAAQCVSDDPVSAELFGTRVIEHGEEGLRDEVLFYEWNLTLFEGFGASNVSLYDVLDDTIWRLDPDGINSTSYWLDQSPHVFVITVTNTDDGAKDLAGIEVPSSLYFDRYLKSNIAATKEMRSKAATLRGAYRRISPKIKNLVTFKHPQAKTDDVEVLFNSTVKFLQAPLYNFADRDGDVSMDGTGAELANTELLAMLDVLQDRVRRKVSST